MENQFERRCMSRLHDNCSHLGVFHKLLVPVIRDREESFLFGGAWSETKLTV